MNYTLYILISILILIIIFIPGKRKNYIEKYNNNQKKLSLKNSLKTIPNLVTHLIV